MQAAFTLFLELIWLFAFLASLKLSSLLISDNVNGAGRSIANGVNTVGPVTIESCTTACFNAGFAFAGAEFAE